METKHIIIKNKFGYYEVKNKPTEQELKDYYSKKYYQNKDNKAKYCSQYDEDELNYYHNEIKRIHVVTEKNNVTNKSVLDIGCGEGFVLKYFKELGYDVCGLDFSNEGIKNHNKNLLSDVIVGNVYDNLDSLIGKKRKFGIVILKHVLEHVLDPISLMKQIKNILVKDSMLIIEVPNDFSKLQQHLLEKKMVDKKYWVATPDHLSYFNLQSLINLSEHCGYNVEYYMSDYPIDFDLFNDNTNYIKNNVGKDSHRKRIKVDNFLCGISFEKTNEYYKKLCELGCGRQIYIFLKLR